MCEGVVPLFFGSLLPESRFDFNKKLRLFLPLKSSNENVFDEFPLPTSGTPLLQGFPSVSNRPGQGFSSFEVIVCLTVLETESFTGGKFIHKFSV